MADAPRYWNGFGSWRPAPGENTCRGQRGVLLGGTIHGESGTQSIVTLGPLIHNHHVVDFLAERGINAIDDVNQASGGTVIIRAHGTTPAVLQQLKARGVDVCNATCPKVGNVQGIVKGAVSRGSHVFIAGDTGHAEVISLMGYADGKATLLQTPDQVLELDPVPNAILVSQTTFNRETFHEIAARLSQKCRSLDVHDTICDSTRKRQDEVRDIARRSDCVVIVGGRHSANTCRLVEIAKEHCGLVYHVESETELQDLNFEGIRTVGVSAGASTPNWLIHAVVQTLRFLEKRKSAAFRLYAWLFHAHLYRAGAAFLLSMAIQMLFGGKWIPSLSVIAMLYLFSITNLNRLVELDGIQYVDPIRYHFVRTHFGLLMTLSLASLLLQIVIACRHGATACTMLMLAAGLGLLYRIRFPLKGRMIRIFDIPGSKNILHGLAWSMVIAAIPLHAMNISVPAVWISACLTVFLTVFTGSILFDVRDLQGDRFHGKETLPILLGPDRTLGWTTLLHLVVMLVLLTFGMLLKDPAAMVNATLTPLYGLLLLNAIRRHKRITVSLWFEVLVDGMAMIPLLALVPALFLS